MDWLGTAWPTRQGIDSKAWATLGEDGQHRRGKSWREAQRTGSAVEVWSGGQRLRMARQKRKGRVRRDVSREGRCGRSGVLWIGEDSVGKADMEPMVQARHEPGGRGEAATEWMAWERTEVVRQRRSE